MFTTKESRTESRRRALEALHAAVVHPRSLARPTATWRPPTVTLPHPAGRGGFTAAVSRYRVGPKVRARLLGYGETRTPVYLVTIRITQPSGLPVPRARSDAWMAELVGERELGAVHDVGSRCAATYVWLVDAAYRPVRSPASLFVGYHAAA
ncbi:hypothetical protein [Corynebacterium uterequi]|uniref:Uncharacterized protein n=1 Tax=Corynebacterium uterequi TaxID=1072256 RepID=A0A0G3HI83_9CORY|nr:hypothetical protein [Corynebacterium uterequi]AKK10847.1 hypothetical protein CUTER_04205 [Corynebacterium uterequi]